MFLAREAVHFIHLSTALGYFPSFLSWVREEMEQTHEGHVTIIPHLSVSALMQVFSNPSTVRLAWCTRQGELSCYQYLDQIRVRTCVERALNAAVMRLRAAQKHISGGQPAVFDALCGAPAVPDNAVSVPKSGSLGRFVCPPSEASIPRPCSPPPSSPAASEPSPPEVVPDNASEIDVTPLHWQRVRSSSNPWRLDKDLRPATPYNNVPLTPLSATPHSARRVLADGVPPPSPSAAMPLAWGSLFPAGVRDAVSAAAPGGEVLD